MQRLPPDRIQRANEAGEIDLEEYPAPARLRAGDQPALGARADLLGVHVQEGRSLLEVQRAADEGEGGEGGWWSLWIRPNGSREAFRSIDAHEQPWVWFRALGSEVSRMQSWARSLEIHRGSFEQNAFNTPTWSSLGFRIR